MLRGAGPLQAAEGSCTAGSRAGEMLPQPAPPPLRTPNWLCGSGRAFLFRLPNLAMLPALERQALLLDYHAEGRNEARLSGVVRN